MNNKEIASVFKLVGQLMELHGENKFKTRSYSNLAFQIGKYPKPLTDLASDELEQIPGLGKNIASKLQELLETGEMEYLQRWLDQTPQGVVEMLAVKGMGPSKVRTVWQDMEIESIGELLYACNENRLVDLKGFGEKTQASVKASIEFMMEQRNKFHYSSIEGLIEEVREEVMKANPDAKIEVVGEAARKCPMINKLEFVVTDNASDFPDTSNVNVDIKFHSVSESEFEMECFKRSATEEHLKQLNLNGEHSVNEVYSSNDLGFIPAEMREGRFEFDWIKAHSAEDLITDQDLRGCLHNHSTYSDGIHTLEEMATFLKEAGYEYFGISDHSQTAVYASGLKEDEIRKQHEEIDKLNEKLAPFKILKGIESDILGDGSLDYPESVLKTFDFVVASIHSSMKMDEETATKRLIKAIENPYTSILGHPTGRLLLSRPGYPIHHKKIIDACAANGVHMELNANPMRLDIDWTWIPYCMEKGVKVSINPDAHRKEGFDHMRYGVMAARKGGLTKSMCLNAMGLEDLLGSLKS